MPPCAGRAIAVERTVIPSPSTTSARAGRGQERQMRLPCLCGRLPEDVRRQRIQLLALLVSHEQERQACEACRRWPADPSAQFYTKLLL